MKSRIMNFPKPKSCMYFFTMKHPTNPLYLYAKSTLFKRAIQYHTHSSSCSKEIVGPMFAGKISIVVNPRLRPHTRYHKVSYFNNIYVSICVSLFYCVLYINLFFFVECVDFKAMQDNYVLELVMIWVVVVMVQF